MKPSDLELARLALAWGWLDRAGFQRCLREADRCQAMGLDKGIDEILLEERRLDADQLRKLRRHLGWSLERTRIGGFEILRRVGVGGSGSVFEARHVRLGQRVALKVLYPRYAKNRRMTSLFLREARALARLNHPHLVHAFDCGRDGGYFYLAMEYVEGENLLQSLTRDGSLAVNRSLEIVKAVCGALSVLEARRLVHRDIKPANILLTADGGVKLADLGLLKIETGADAPEEWVCGTPHYLSPEQARGDGEVDIRSDLYSLGATWYHALAGRPPFVGASSREIMVAHATREPPPLRKFRDDVPLSVERTLLGWLSKDPDARPATSRQAIEELGRLERSTRRSTGARGSAARWGLIAVSLLVACAAAIWIGVPTGSLPESSSPTGDPTADAAADTHSESAAVRAAHDGPSRAVPARSVVEKVAAPSTSDVAPPRGRAAERDAPAGSGGAPVVTAESESRALRPASIARTVSRSVGMLADDFGRVWNHGLEGLVRLAAPVRDRFDVLSPLGRGFHASRTALAPLGETDVVVLLDYDFLSDGELDDFRARPGSTLVRGGDLVAVDEPFGTTIESVAWFTPPLRLAGEVSPDARLTLGFGDLRVSPWVDRARADGAGASSTPSRSADPLLNARPVFELHLDQRGHYVRAGDHVRFERTPVPVTGRVSIALEGGRLRWLRIESRLEPTWAAERLRILERAGE